MSSIIQKNVKTHFVKRAQRYNHSAKWVDDTVLIGKMRDLAEPKPEAYVLDIGIGTGKIAAAFNKKVKSVVGIDICIDIVKEARQYSDAIVLSPAEKMPFKDNIFDVCICRQGLQFMELDNVLEQIYRVLKPKGIVILCHLTAYDDRDKYTTFLIQRLRNPARRHFFLPQDFLRLLKKNNFVDVGSSEYITKESVKRWIDNGAIDETEKEKIRDIYRNAPDDFKEIHNIQFKDGDIFDSMKMLIVKGKKI